MKKFEYMEQYFNFQNYFENNFNSIYYINPEEIKNEYGTRFKDEYPEHGRELIVTMNIGGRNITIIGYYSKKRQRILNYTVGVIDLDPNDVWKYTSDKKHYYDIVGEE